MELIIKKLREKKSFSQEELAKLLGISRQTYINYESGKSEMPLDIVRKLAKTFNVNYSCIIDNKLPSEYGYKIEKELYVKEAEPEYRGNFRINISERNIEKFKQVFIYIISKIGAKPNIGQTILEKLLYFIDFDYFELYKKKIMGLSYIKLANGPVPVDFSELINQMENDGEIEKIVTDHYKHDMTKFIPVINPHLDLLNAKELIFINKEIEKYKDLSAEDFTEYVQKDIPCTSTKDNEIIDYEAVFYRNK